MRQFNSHERARSWCVTATALAFFTVTLGAGRAMAQTDLTRDNLPPSDPQVAQHLPGYLQSRGARFIDWLADGSMLIATRFGQSTQIHRVRGPLGMREQVSFAPGGVAAATARPYASDAFVYLQRSHGDELGQLWLQPLAAPQPPSALTDAGHRDGEPLFAHDGKRLAFVSNRANGADIDVYLLDTSTPGAPPRLLIGGSGNHWRLFDWSVDDKHLLLGRELTGGGMDASADCELYIADVDSGTLTAVAAEAPKAASGKRAARSRAAAAPINPLHVRQARFATDGHGLLLLTRQNGSGADSAFVHLAYADQNGAEWRAVSLEAPHDVERFDQSPDGHYLAYTLNDNGISRLVLIDQQRKLDLNIGELPAGVIRDLKFDATGKHLALSLESTQSPRDVYVLEPDTHLLTRWTQSEVGAIDVRGFALPEALRFPTWDRIESQPRELTGLAYRAAAGAAAPHPVLIVLPGLHAQNRPDFEPFLQYLATQRGVVVLAPNVRGASGLGATLEQLGEGALRGDATRDVGSLLVWIGLQRELDRNRVAVLGEGEGAYLALQSLAAYADRLLGGIAAFPPHIAPLENIPSIRRPLLLVQGLHNRAVPANELEQLRSRLRVNGDTVSYLGAENEGRRFTQESDRDAYFTACADFLAQLLR